MAILGHLCYNEAIGNATTYFCKVALIPPIEHEGMYWVSPSDATPYGIRSDSVVASFGVPISGSIRVQWKASVHTLNSRV